MKRMNFRQEVEAATAAELARHGPVAFRKAAVASMFAGRGPSRSTLYRWIDAVVDASRAGQLVARQIGTAAQRLADPAAVDTLRLAIAREMLRTDPDLAARMVRRLLEAGDL